jgi:hypothetical protein
MPGQRGGGKPTHESRNITNPGASERPSAMRSPTVLHVAADILDETIIGQVDEAAARRCRAA